MNRNATLLALALAFATPALVEAQTQAPAASSPSQKAVETRAALRDLWLGHVFWVRNVVDARLAKDTQRAQAAEQQVVANAKSIAGAIEPFYGKAASEKLFELLAGHWGAISGYLDAIITGSKPGQDAALEALGNNAGQIATFLSGANPNLPADTLRALLNAHGGHHVQQIEQLQARRYADEARTWAAMKDHMYVIADALAGGIAKQFPDRFR